MATRVFELRSLALTTVLAIALAGCAGGGGAATAPPSAEPVRTPSGVSSSATADEAVGDEGVPNGTSAVGDEVQDGETQVFDSLERIEQAETDLEKAAYTVLAFETLYALARVSGDASDLRVISGPDCKLCADAIRDVEELASQGEKALPDMTWTQWGAHASEPAPEIGANYYSGLVYYSTSEVTFVDADENVVATIEPAEYAILADVEEVDGQWRIVQLLRVQPDVADEHARDMVRMEGVTP